MKNKIRGRYWDFQFTDEGIDDDALGHCDSPTTKGKQIRVRPDLSPPKELEIVLHEHLHAGLWDLDEEAVEELGEDLSRVLWKLGYRRVPL